ncbi:MAG: helix-turn-helix transcriptional regulator [Lentisphaeria bacterium]|nr:helix-turn-helix transcriptional regulator [Lentisphaeria bacterium]
MNEIKKILFSGIKRFICSSMPAENYVIRNPMQISRHSEVEFLFVLHGESMLPLNNKLFKAETGDMFIIDSWEPHAFGYFNHDHDLLHLWLHLNKNCLKGDILQVKSNGQFRYRFHPFELPYDITDLIRRRCSIARKKEGFITEESVDKYLHLPLKLLINEILLHFEQNHIAEIRNNTNDVIGPVKQYIQAAHGAHCSLDEIEKYTGYNKFYFSHLFKVKTNSTIGEYVNHVRIRYTAEADVYGIKHKDIATAIGFSSISAYCQWKRKYKNKIEELKEQIKRELKSEKKNI